MTQDEQQLNLLGTFHYVVAGLCALFACFPIIHLVLGIVMIVSPESLNNGKGQPPPEFVGWMFVAIGACAITLGWTMAAFIAVAGARLKRRKSYTFCLVMAALECMFMPFGTVLGVFTIIMLSKDPVKALFGIQPPAPPAPPASGAIP